VVKMKVWKIVTLIIVLGSITAPLVARLTTWLSPPVQAAMLAVVPPAAAAIVLVAYFEWRAWLKRRIVASDRYDDELVTAA
jgi:hypothetical protein